eukprot:CAMPEP_0170493278 /NCGR_PEP_ID=MMETSP0208-20121228/13640_1 /TAXON_ID=197538 /ORGANISM="Strombidium inclinatum, Strain S3" /LENGTH=149 /DNA_ID=CAMNT_0010769181 /DNA_START=269 /DNA_END=718 /DNA_ORIENTATION=-
MLEQKLGCYAEYFLYFISCFGAGLEAHMYVVFKGELHGPVEIDHSLISQLRLVSNEEDSRIFIRMFLDLIQPNWNSFEGLLASNIIAKEHAVCISVEDPGHRPEGLLPSSIPNLQFDRLLLDVQGVRSEIYPDSDLMHEVEVVVHHSVH